MEWGEAERNRGSVRVFDVSPVGTIERKETAVTKQMQNVHSESKKVVSALPRRPKALDPAPPEFDRVIHERLRLGILSALAVNDSVTFNELKKLMDTTDGNLSVHARKLEEAGYLLCEKSFAGRLPRTEYRISASGRRALERYLDEMEQFIKAARKK